MPEAFICDKEVPTRWRVWAVINGFFIGGQVCWASNEWIAEKVNSHKDTVSQAVKELENNKIIRCERGARSRRIYPMIGINAYQWSAPTPTSDRHRRLSNSVSNSEKEFTSESKIREVTYVSDEELGKKPSKTAKYPHHLEIFALWGKYPKNWLLNNTQKQAAENLYEERGIEAVRDAIEWYEDMKEKQKDNPHFYLMTSPWDLDSKWDKLESFSNKKI